MERRFQVKVVRGPALPFRTGEIDLELTIKGIAVSYTHLRAHETVLDLVCRLLLEKKTKQRSLTNVT